MLQRAEKGLLFSVAHQFEKLNNATCMGDQNQYSVSGNSKWANPLAVDKKTEPRPLSDLEIQDVMRQRELLHQLAPEFESVIKEMYDLGLIDGWRALKVTPKNID